MSKILFKGINLERYPIQCSRFSREKVGYTRLVQTITYYESYSPNTVILVNKNVIEEITNYIVNSHKEKGVKFKEFDVETNRIHIQFYQHILTCNEDFNVSDLYVENIGENIMTNTIIDIVALCRSWGIINHIEDAKIRVEINDAYKDREEK